MSGMDWALVGYAVLAAVYFAVVKLRKRFGKKPEASDFAKSIAHSMRRNADDWDYDLKENWLLNRVASIAVNLQTAHWGDVDMLQPPNSGTQTIARLRGIDKNLVEEAYGEWKAITELSRTQLSERRKRDAMAVLGRP